MAAISNDALHASIAKGTRWVFYWRMATRALGLVSTLVLIRVLAPADFGLVALATGIASAVEQFGWLGVENAIIREKAPGRDVYDTGFTINAIRSLLTGSCVAVAAYPAASFFGEARLANIMLALAGATLLAGAENIGVVDFRRDFTFNKEFVYLLMPRLASIALAIGTALLFHSYWALVVGIVSSRVLRVLSSYVMHPYRPRFSLSAWRVLASYSIWTWVLGMAVLVRDRSDTMVIGRMMTSVQVGIYSIAFDLASLTTAEIIEPLQRAAFSGFVAARNSGVPLREPLLRVLGSVSLFALPATIGTSLVADPLLKLVVGLKWTEAVPLVEILGVAGATIVAGYTCRTMLSSSDRLGSTIGITFAFGVLRVGAMILAISIDGLPGAAVAAGGAMALEGVAYIVVTCRKLDISLAQLLGPIWRAALATVAMAAGLWGLGLGWQRTTATSPLVLGEELATASLTGAAIFVSVLFAAWTASGRPEGAEADAMAVARKALGRLRRPTA